MLRNFYSLVFALLSAVAVYGPLTPETQAAVILNVSNGQLTGAQNVNVQGTLYDVSFTDGTCLDLFSGCDNAASDFTFTTFDSAFAAATALVEQVFIDTVEGLFGSDPELTQGCEGLAVCFYSIPYTISRSRFDALIAHNLADNGADFVSSSFAFQTTDYFGLPNDTFAVFSLASNIPVQVSEPSTLLLFGVAMLGVGIAFRRRQRTPDLGPWKMSATD